VRHLMCHREIATTMADHQPNFLANQKIGVENPVDAQVNPKVSPMWVEILSQGDLRYKASSYLYVG